MMITLVSHHTSLFHLFRFSLVPSKSEPVEPMMKLRDGRTTVTVVALLGAGGKMGYRLSANLKGSEFVVRHIEVSEAGRIRLKDGLGVSCVDVEEGVPGADVVILAGPAGSHVELAETWLKQGSHVISISDDPDDVTGLLDLDSLASSRERSLVVGAGFVPGLSCLLTRYAADMLDTVEIISIYKAGTGGPACARQHHRALKRSGHDWLDGNWVLRRGGSGRDLAWFPDPFGARDCYRGALPSPTLLQRVFPEAERISSRIAATRRDRLTSWLPMLRPPHDDGGPGAIRVEVRGRRNRAVETIILGVIDHPSVAAGTVAAVAAAEAVAGQTPIGAHGLAAWSEPKRILAELHRRGVRVATFNGLLALT